MKTSATLAASTTLLFALTITSLARADLDEAARQEAHRKAQQFIDNEKQFHLGVLPTEQSHPKTRGLAEMAPRDLPLAIHMLQAVDEDIPPKTAQVLASPEFQRLYTAMSAAISSGHRICFSGCGATGRLSILLETAWRRACRELRQQCPAEAAILSALEGQVVSIMTGGDYALIRSVEYFEDHAIFGRRQVQELQLGKGDVLVAISEGGETSSVIGTVWQALDNGAQVFFVFNNPSQVLAAHIERSRQVIQDARVTKLDLSTGPMAVAGSTRMQATTCELLVVGAALDRTMFAFLRARIDAARRPQLQIQDSEPPDAARQFTQLLEELGKPQAVAAMAAMVQFEERIYRRKGLVTYLADRCLLDIFTDTTERSPTFALPRFRRSGDRISPTSWAFVKNPLLPTPQAWREVLCRQPRCLAWDAAAYRQMNAPPALQQNPPRISADEMFQFLIGNEEDPSRYEGRDSAAILVVLGEEVARLASPGDPLRAALETAARPFARRAVLAIGPTPPPADLPATVWYVPVHIPASPTRLWDRLAAKLVLNTVSTATMARMGRLASNWMVCVEPTNKKLIDRGTRLVAEVAGVDYRTACYALFETIEDISRNLKPDQEKPSPVALTIARLKHQPTDAH